MKRPQRIQAFKNILWAIPLTFALAFTVADEILQYRDEVIDSLGPTMKKLIEDAASKAFQEGLEKGRILSN